LIIYGFLIIVGVIKVLKFFTFLGNDISLNAIYLYFFILIFKSIIFGRDVTKIILYVSEGKSIYYVSKKLITLKIKLLFWFLFLSKSFKLVL